MQFEMGGPMKGRGCSYNVDASQISIKPAESTRILLEEKKNSTSATNTNNERTTTNERGTGGTSILPFLRTSRDETRQVKVQLN